MAQPRLQFLMTVSHPRWSQSILNEDWFLSAAAPPQGTPSTLIPPPDPPANLFCTLRSPMRGWSLPAAGTLLPPSSPGGCQVFPPLLQVPTNATFLVSSLLHYFKEYTPNASPSAVSLFQKLPMWRHYIFCLVFPCHVSTRMQRTQGQKYFC